MFRLSAEVVVSYLMAQLELEGLLASSLTGWLTGRSASLVFDHKVDLCKAAYDITS